MIKENNNTKLGIYMIIIEKPGQKKWILDVNGSRLLKNKKTKIETSNFDLFKKTESKPVNHDKKKRLFY